MRDEGRVHRWCAPPLNVVFREITPPRRAALLDIYRGVPFVYLNYSATTRSRTTAAPTPPTPRSRCAPSTDRWPRSSTPPKRFGARPYDVILLSDHGQSTTIPWEHLHGQSLTEFILDHVASARLIKIGADHRSKLVGRSLAFTSWLREMEWTLPRPLGRWVSTVAGWMSERLPDEAAGIDWSADGELMVAPTGSLAHVYFTATPSPLDIARRFAPSTARCSRRCWPIRRSRRWPRARATARSRSSRRAAAC